MATNDLTAERLRQVLDYDPATGRFTRRKNGRVVGNKSGSGYITIYVDGANRNAHRLAWLHVHGKWPSKCIDHINGIRTDNRIENLRDVEQSENIRCKRVSKGRSGLVGVSFHKATGKWAARASLRPLAPTTHLGTFETAEAAHQAYLVAIAGRL